MDLGIGATTVLFGPPLRLAPVTAHEQAVFWVQVAALLTLALVLGRLASRWGQPPVVGQLLAGVILGPTVLGELWPAGFGWFLPQGKLVQSSLLFAVSTLSLAILLLSVGFETDVTLLRRLGRPAVWVSAGSLLLPVGAGVGVGLLLPSAARGPAGSAWSFALLVGVALGASSLPVISEIVGHLGATRRDFGQITLAAGTVNDAAAFVLIALAVALGASGAVSQLAKVVIGLAVLGALAALVAQPLVDRLLRAARRRTPARGPTDPRPALAVCMVAATVAAALVQLIGIEGALGAFVAGVVLARSRFADAGTLRVVAQLSAAFFAPLYFATAGLQANLLLLRLPQTLPVFGILLIVGAATKFAGTYLGAAAGRLPRMERIALGIGLNGRGTVQVIAGTVGLAAGILDTGTYTAIVAMSLLTSLATPPLLRRAVRRWEGSPEERRRLDLEERISGHLLVTEKRVLMVVDQERAGADAIWLVAHAWPEGTALTVITTDSVPRFRESATPYLGEREVEWRVAEPSPLAEAVESEQSLGYGSLVVASRLNQGEADPQNGSLDRLLPRVALPTAIVLRPDGEPAEPTSPSGILVPVSGARASRAALEVAFSLGERTGDAVHLLHVDTSPRGAVSHRSGLRLPRRPRHITRDHRAAAAILSQARAMGSGYRARVHSEVLRSPNFEPGLLAAARSNRWVFLGVRPVSTDAGIYYGEAAEALLGAIPDRSVLLTLPD